MKTYDTNFFQLFIGVIVVLFGVSYFSNQAHAAIKCQTAYHEKSFTIEEQSVAFHKEQEGRSISSIHNVKTQKRLLGVDKVVYLDGMKHKIHIENQNSFNEADDYLSITSKQGHQMTYPLNCQAM